MKNIINSRLEEALSEMQKITDIKYRSSLIKKHFNSICEDYILLVDHNSDLTEDEKKIYLDKAHEIYNKFYNMKN